MEQEYAFFMFSLIVVKLSLWAREVVQLTFKEMVSELRFERDAEQAQEWRGESKANGRGGRNRGSYKHHQTSRGSHAVTRRAFKHAGVPEAHVYGSGHWVNSRIAYIADSLQQASRS